MIETESLKVNIPEGKLGNCRIEKFTVTEEQEKMERLRSAFSFSSRGRATPAGTYTRLIINGQIVMSDTPDEIRDQWGIIHAAKGHVLINGLGLGITAKACLDKPEVSKVTVIEINREVVSLVGSYYKEVYGDRIEIINADAREFKPNKGSKFGAVWHDIWNDICEDNLPEMHKLHRKYGRLTEWQGSWCREYLEYQMSRNR